MPSLQKITCQDVLRWLCLWTTFNSSDVVR